MAFDLKEIAASCLDENYDLHEWHLNRTLVAAQAARHAFCSKHALANPVTAAV